MSTTTFLSGGAQLTAKIMNAAMSVGLRAGVYEQVNFSVFGDELTLSPHKCAFENGAVLVSSGEKLKLSSYLNLSSNSYRGTVLYTLDSSLHFESSFSIVDGIQLQSELSDSVVIGWVLHPGGSSAITSEHFHSAPVVSDSKWLATFGDIGEQISLTKTLGQDGSYSYVNETSQTVVATFTFDLAVALEFVRSLRFNGGLDNGVHLDCFVSSQRQPEFHVASLVGPQASQKFRLPVFAFQQGEYEITKVKFRFTIPTLRGFTMFVLGATNEVSYEQSVTSY